MCACNTDCFLPSHWAGRQFVWYGHKRGKKITNKKEWGVKTAVSLVMPNHHQPKPYDQVAHKPGSSPNKK